MRRGEGLCLWQRLAFHLPRTARYYQHANGLFSNYKRSLTWLNIYFLRV